MAQRILVVDDEDGLRTVLQDTLELEGYEVITCADAASAKAYLESSRFDVALLDVFLSDKPEGIELAKYIRSTYPEIKVVLMTGYALDKDIRNGYASGVYACIRKPFLLDDLLRVINTVLNQ